MSIKVGDRVIYKKSKREAIVASILKENNLVDYEIRFIDTTPWRVGRTWVPGYLIEKISEDTSMELKTGTIVEVISDCKSKGRIGEVLRVWNTDMVDVRLEREPIIDPHQRTYAFSKKSLKPVFGKSKETSTSVDKGKIVAGDRVMMIDPAVSYLFRREGDVLSVTDSGEIANVKFEMFDRTFMINLYTNSLRLVRPYEENTTIDKDEDFQYIIYDREPMDGEFSIVDSKEELKEHLRKAVIGCDMEDAEDYLRDVEVYKVTGIEKVNVSLNYDINID